MTRGTGVHGTGYRAIREDMDGMDCKWTRYFWIIAFPKLNKAKLSPQQHNKRQIF